MSKRAILLLALVAAALAGYVALFERGSVTSKELAARSGRVLVDFVRDKVDYLEVQRKGKKVVLIRVKVGPGELGGWQMREPMLARADTDAVDSLLGELEWLSARRSFDTLSDADIQRFGLDKPRYRISYHVGGTSHTLTLGQNDVHNDGVYARIDDQRRAFVVPKSVLDPIDREPGHFRDKQLFPNLVIEWAHKLSMVHGDTRLELTKDRDRFWLEGSPRLRAHAKRVKELIEMVSGARATRYLEGAELKAAEASLAVPKMRIEVKTVPDTHREDKQPETFALEVGGDCAGHPDERYARVVGGPLVCMLSGDLIALDREPSTLRDTRLIASDVSSVRGIELMQGASKLVLTRDGDTWKGQGGIASDRTAIESWLLSLSVAQATGFHPGEPLAQRGTLTLTLYDDQRERIVIGAVTQAGEQLVQRADEAVVASYPPSVADRLQPIKTRFTSLEVWASHQPSEVVSLDARVPGHTRALALSEQTWRAKDGGALDSERTRVLVRALVDLHARSYLTDQPRAAHAVADSDTRLSFGLRSGKKLELALGAATERGKAALIDGRAVVEVDPRVGALIEELAGSRPSGSAELLRDEDDEDDEDAPSHDHAH